MKRILLFLATNIAIMLVLSIVLRLLGVDSLLEANNSSLNLTSLAIFAGVFGMGGSFISLMISKWSAKRMVGAHVIETPRNSREAWLVHTVQGMAKEAGIAMPEVALYESPEVNAFATGPSKNNALVAVSTGLLNEMSEKEAEAVIGHEVAHIANGDMVTMALIQGVVNAFVIFFARIVGHLVDRVIFKNEEGHGMGYFIGSFLAEIVFSVLASIIVFWFSRQREFRADKGGAYLAGRGNMIAALRRLQTYQQRLQEGQGALPQEMAAFGISGGKKTSFAALFMTHPPLEERIAALEAATKE